MGPSTWVPVPDGSGFPIQNLPYGVFSRPGEPRRVGVAVGEQVLDLAGLAGAGALGRRRWFAARSLNRFMAAGPAAWRGVRARITELLTSPEYRPQAEPHLIPLPSVQLHLPFDVADYVDFYASRDHAENVGRIFRPHSEPLAPNWLHMPVGYHGRAGTVVVSGTPVRRPVGQRTLPGDVQPSFGPTARLDIEAEVGFVAGVPSAAGQPVPVQSFRDHVFGFVLVNDWSARDIQAWESRPLGPFLGKSFATSVSPWVVPVAALEAARVQPPLQVLQPLDHLRCAEPWGLDLALEIELNGHVVARPPFATMYWTPPQQLAHATSNGALLRTGDLFASGTVSGPERRERGSLLELTWDGREPLDLPDGTRRAFLADGDVVRIRASAPAGDGTRIGFGEVAGTVSPAQ
jgi:fumarylacetoacetase